MPSEQKEILRNQFRSFRAQLTPEVYEERSAAIVARMQALPELRQAQTVHCYWPLVERHEIDVRPLITWLHERGLQVVLPVVQRYVSRSSVELPRLRHARYDGPATLRPNRWGIHEPSAGPSVPIEDLEAVVVPALGAGRNGHRIGHGLGYYDAFLSQVAVPTLCPVFDGCLSDWVEPEAHDVRVSVIITEHETLRPLRA